jgi:hypothetical protein
VLQTALDDIARSGVPLGNGHGACGEIFALAKALNSGVTLAELEGAISVAVFLRGDNVGKIGDPCDLCKELLGKWKIDWAASNVDDPNF